MGKVTSKLQVTIPKAIADKYGIRPGQELQWVPAGDAIRVTQLRVEQASHETLSADERVAIFDAATWRQQERDKRLRGSRSHASEPKDRGWTRKDLYRRGRAD